MTAAALLTDREADALRAADALPLVDLYDRLAHLVARAMSTPTPTADELRDLAATAFIAARRLEA